MKKIICYIIIFCFITIMPVNAYDTYESEMVPGIIRKVITNYTSSGSQRINVLEIDLSNPNLKISLLSDTEGISYLENVKNMASQDERIVAAINGDFFAWYSQDKSRGSAVGLNGKDGEIITSAPTDEELASLVFTTEGAILTQYFRPNIKVTDSEGNTKEVLTLNKFSSLANLAMYNTHWGKTFTCNGGGETIAVIEEDKVTRVVTEAEEITIPENGYLLAGLSDFTDFILNLKPESKITADISFTPYFGDIETAIGGGTVLVKNGEKAPITHMRYGRDFRSAIGVSSDDKTLYFITVDKSKGSIGMTLDELTSFMLSLGIYDGINLDGGGSTQLVGRGYADEKISYINSPENNYYRPVANALAIALRDGTRGVPEGITVKTSADTFTVKQKITADFALYDQLYYPLKADGSATYTFSGVKGKREGNTFISEESGTLKITAKYKSYTATKRVSITDPDIYVDCDAILYEVKTGDILPLKINALTLSGKQRNIPLNDVIITADENILSVNGSNITAINPGFGTINFKYKEFEFSAYVSVNNIYPEDNFSVPKITTDNFEKENGTSLSYPADTFSEYQQTSEKSTSIRGKLSFDFNNDITDLQSAYLNFREPIKISRKFTDITIDVESIGYTDVLLKAMITDCNGDIHRISFGDLSEKGEKTFKLSLPDTIPLPAYLSRIYVVEKNSGTKESGYIYMDNLTILEGGLGDYLEDNLKTDNLKAPTLIVTGGINQTSTILDVVSAEKVKKELSSSPISYSFSSLTIADNHTYNSCTSSGGITFINFDSSTKENLQESEKTVVITIARLTNSKKQEILNMAEENPGKTFFVLSEGVKPYVEIINDIRFVTLPSAVPEIITNQATYVTFSIGKVNGKIKYSINHIPLWKK